MAEDDEASLSLTSSAMAKKQGRASLFFAVSLTETAKSFGEEEEEERVENETLGELAAVKMADENADGEADENADGEAERINIVS